MTGINSIISSLRENAKSAKINTLRILLILMASQFSLVHGASAYGWVKDLLTGEILVGAVVSLELNDGTILSDTTNDYGRYSFKIDSSGDVATVTAQYPGYIVNDGELVLLTEIRYEYNINMVPDVEPVGTGTISGTVVDKMADSLPIENAQVIVYLIMGGSAGLEPVDTAYTDVNGSFSFADLAAPAGYTVIATVAGFESMSLDVGLDQDETEMIILDLIGATTSLRPFRTSSPAALTRAPRNQVFMLYDLQGRRVFEGTSEELIKLKSQAATSRKLVEPAR